MKRKIRIRVAGLLLEEDRVLMVQHKKDHKSYWLLPGGGVKYGESLADAVKREFLEELGIDVEVGDTLFVSDAISPKGKRHIVNVIFVCKYLSGEYSLGDDKRLVGFDFIDKERLHTIVVYPPFKESLIDYMDTRERSTIYLGSKWNK